MTSSILPRLLVPSLCQLFIVIFTNCDDTETPIAQPQVTLANGGVVAGLVSLSRSNRLFDAYLGIPFATVPERFQEAKPITTPISEGVFNASKPSLPCPQAVLQMSEDCLSLNIYIPRLSNETNGPEVSLPVMVWIHGGAFIKGSGSSYPPFYFMSEDVILVTVNYRLGVFGFLSTGDNVITGNAGLKDMVLALKWVQENIKQFGGDPSKVTIFGESAGGAAVQYLMLSPTSQGLFHRAISQSGSALNLWAYQPHPKKYAVLIATALNCTSETGNVSEISSAEILKCLQGASVGDLVKAQYRMKRKVSNFPPIAFAPTVEPTESVSSLTPFITESPIALMTNKDTKLAGVPMIVGATEDEGSSIYAGIILSHPRLLKDLDEKWDSIAPNLLDYGSYLSKEEGQQVTQKVRDFYFADKNISEETRVSVRNVVSDEMFLHGIIRSARELASRGASNPVYLYQYAYKGSRSDFALSLKITGEELTKVGHTDELQQQFGRKSGNNSQEELEFSQQFVHLWTSFATNGEPSHSWGKDADSKWESIKPGEEVDIKWYRLQIDPSFVDVDQSVKDRIKFWDSLWNDTILPAVSGAKAT